MGQILSAAQMRAVERGAIASGAVTGLELMERAGRAVADLICARWPGGAGGAAPAARGGSPEVFAQRRRAVVLCGPGNNGGDGFVIARHLRLRGWDVELFLFGQVADLRGDARAMCARWEALGAVQPWEACLRARWTARPVVVDAVFGTGLTRAIPGAVRDVLLAVEDCAVVAVDVPSMLSADQGNDLGGWPKAAGFATLTVSFHRLKLGHVLAVGPRLCGKVVVADIGLSGDVPGAAEWVSAPVGLDKRGGHKFEHGAALVAVGGLGRSGAARLAARAALRVGAGLVTLAAPGAAMMECAARIEAVMLCHCDDAAALAALLEDGRISALCLGPGLGHRRARDLVPVAVAAQRSVVLDADALGGFADAPARLFEALHDGCVLTPHGGEFARLFPDLASLSPPEAARAAAARAGCVVLLKGPVTAIAAPSGAVALHVAQYERAAPWLATAGSGDVLAGLICGLLARGRTPWEAACAGAWLHGAAALRFGPGLIAEDLPDQIPGVLRALLA